MTLIFTQRKKIALALLLIISFNIFSPTLSYALTSGPTQPETQAFQPAGTTDMVDTFTGGFKYNIPLLDVDGYPVNLNYQSGVGMDDEASWAGLGWNVNIGAINRQLRGLPDDFSGDQVVTEHYTKPKVTVGGTVRVKGELGGHGKSINGSLSLGIFSDNYTGIGAEVGANAGMKFSLTNDGLLTAGLGVGIVSNTSEGVSLSPFANLSISSNKDAAITSSAGLSASLGYNTRSGMKSLSLGSSFNVGNQDISLATATISYNTEPISPKIQIPYKSTYGSISIAVGGAFGPVFLGGEPSGYKSTRRVNGDIFPNPAYGFLYANVGKDQANALMDFTREKENPVIPELPNLAIPVHTPDIFSYTSQAGGGQFKLYRGGTGAFFDNEVNEKSENQTAGLDLGFGWGFHGGVTYFEQNSSNSTRKWKNGNAYLAKGDFQNNDNTLQSAYTEPVYFKQIGEKTMIDNDMDTKLDSTKALAVKINSRNSEESFREKPITNSLIRNKRELRSTNISYLNALEASRFGLDKKIKNYPLNQVVGFIPKPVADSISRTPNPYFSRYGHLSEMTVTTPEGKRMVYGIPTYNTRMEEYTFAIGKKVSDYNVLPNDNQVVLSPNIISNTAIKNPRKGIDHYYNKQTTPAYATSFLLTGILSPDYVDVTGNGISFDDDLGTAIKFNYSKLAYNYKWRTPYAAQSATVNKAQLADADDDKATVIYGEKELWYTHSIETKTKIAYFFTADRNDALGVKGLSGGQDVSQKQKCLTEIRLYSKSDMSKPIKVVKFTYDYSLCPGIPNNLNYGTTNNTNLGKLTLKSVWFEYGTSKKGENRKYLFAYDNRETGVIYANMLSDRWGTYKPAADNAPFALNNEEFPYVAQDMNKSVDAILPTSPQATPNKDKLDKYAGLWNLNKITLPTGGIIDITYEANDYAYVQNKKAMVMTELKGLVDANFASTDLINAKGIKVILPETIPPNITDTTNWFKRNYLNSSDYIYTKFFVKMANENSANTLDEDGNYDFNPCYSKITRVGIKNNNEAYIFLEDRTEGNVTRNPIIFSAWQRIKNDYPRFAYPGFDRRVDDGSAESGFEQAVDAVLDAVGNLSELKRSFYEKAQKNNYANELKPTKSFVRLTKANGFKLGGGARVQKIQISDSWDAMNSGQAGIAASTYGQYYEYTTTEDGKTISSGVAAYEPSIGADENPLRQPVPYIQRIKGTVGNYFNLEEPFGESFYPAPTVGYSKVTVTNLDENGNKDPNLLMGYIVDEFYTAKEFPALVSVLPIIKNDVNPTARYSFLGSTAYSQATYSQGYSIQLNDMHGKAKANRIFNKAGAEISSTQYIYNAEKVGASEMRLVNKVNVINQNGGVSANQVIGREVEFFTDVREQESMNTGRAINIGLDVIPIFFFPLFLPHFPGRDNTEQKIFRSVCGMKVSQYYGVIDKVVKRIDGAEITTQNEAFDGLTGEALVTSTQNEFKNKIYSVNLPAYWVYKGMGGAYKNMGAIITGLSTDATTGIIPDTYAAYLEAGDELANTSFLFGKPEQHYWVANGSVLGKKILIDKDGKIIKNLRSKSLFFTVGN